MKVYELVLKNEKTQSYKASLPLIIALNSIAFLFLAFNYTITFKKITSLSAAILIALLLVAHFIQKNKKNYAGYIAIIVIIVAYSLLKLYLFGIGMALIYILYEITTRELVVTVSPNNIVYPSFPSKKLEWAELANIVLKDSLLTIDFKNNKILQGEISTVTDEKEFNDFCRNQLTQ